MLLKKDIIKRTIALSLIISSLLLCSCKKTVKVQVDESVKTNVPTQTYPSQPKATNKENIENETVYNANDIIVKAEALDFNDENSDKIRIKFRITNNSKYDLRVIIPKDEDNKETILINGKKVQAILSKTLMKPDTVVWVDFFWHQLRDEHQIETIDNIELKLAFVDQWNLKENDYRFVTDTIKLTTKKA